MGYGLYLFLDCIGEFLDFWNDLFCFDGAKALPRRPPVPGVSEKESARKASPRHASERWVGEGE